jgi:hypothetical protein
VEWDDTRRLAKPGEPEQTNDLVAHLHDDDYPGRTVWLIGEIEEAPEKGILYRLGQYEISLGKEVNPDCDPDGPQVGSLLINLTGRQTTRRLDCSWAGTELGTRLAPFIVDVADEDAALSLTKIEVGLLGTSILPYIVLMRGGCDPKVIDRWPMVAAEREPDIVHQVYYRDAALVFAELTRCQADWLRVLGGWQMRESQYIKGWEKVGEDRGTLLRTREYLLKRLRRLEDPVPEAIRLAIEGTNDVQTLDRWYDAALDVGTIAEFRKALKLET